MRYRVQNLNLSRDPPSPLPHTTSSSLRPGPLPSPPWPRGLGRFYPSLALPPSPGALCLPAHQPLTHPTWKQQAYI
jgi:hypothetical protein